MTLVHALLLPVAFLLTLKVVFGDSITSITGENALYRSVPLVALVATMSGSTTGVVGINAERLDGFLSRLWALPLHRAAGLLSRLAAETIRLLGTTLVLLGAGMILGFRFHRGVAAALLWVAIPVIFGVAFAALANHGRAVLVQSRSGGGDATGDHFGGNLLHGVRAGGAVPGLGPAAGPIPADVTGCRCNAGSVGGWAGAVADDQRTGVVCRASSRCACGRSWWATAGRAPAGDPARDREEGCTVFGSTPIRYLTPSEEFYAQAENFIGITLTLRGPVDVGAMSEAFETLLHVHPAHAGHLDRRRRRQAPNHGR